MPKITSINGFTSTPGAGENLKKVFIFDKNLLNHQNLKKENSIKNLRDLFNYINKENKKKGSRGHRGVSLYRNLVDFGAIISKDLGVNKIDPIEYLIQLYYGDGLSINDIFSRINGKGLNYKDESGLRKLFKNIFNWELKESHNQTEITAKKRKLNHEERKNNLAFQSKKLEENRKIEFLSWFIKNSNENKNSKFDINEYKNLKNKTLKLKYLLKKFYGIGDKELISLKESGIGTRVIAKYLEEILNNILEKFQIEKLKIVPIEITRLLK